MVSARLTILCSLVLAVPAIAQPAPDEIDLRIGAILQYDGRFFVDDAARQARRPVRVSQHAPRPRGDALRPLRRQARARLRGRQARRAGRVHRRALHERRQAAVRQVQGAVRARAPAGRAQHHVHRARPADAARTEPRPRRAGVRRARRRRAVVSGRHLQRRRRRQQRRRRRLLRQGGRGARVREAVRERRPTC